jgi:hypothetical protein
MKSWNEYIKDFSLDVDTEHSEEMFSKVISMLHDKVWKMLYTRQYELDEVIKWIDDNENTFAVYPEVTSVFNRIRDAYVKLKNKQSSTSDTPFAHLMALPGNSAMRDALVINALADASQTNVILEYGTDDYVPDTAPVDDWNYRVSQDASSKYEKALRSNVQVAERESRKHAAKSCYDMFKDMNESFVHLKEILVNTNNASESSPEGLARKLLNLNDKLFSVLFDSTCYKFDHVIVRLEYEIQAINQQHHNVQKSLYSDKVETAVEESPEFNDVYQRILDYYDSVLIILQHFKKAYENYGRHCIALYNPGWLGRPFNVYSYNVFDLEYDNTTYECVNTEKHWWGKSKHYYMSEV